MAAPSAVKEIELDYEPQPKQLFFHNCLADEILYGGAAGGGKSMALFWDAVNTCVHIPGFVAAIFRKTFPELEKTHIRKARALPKSLGTYNASNHQFNFVNGSILEFNYCKNENDVYNYQSGEWDGLYFDELTHFTEFMYTYLLSRVRTTKGGVKTKIKSGSNPGGIGHVWVKKRFVAEADPFETREPPDRSDEEIELNIPPRTRCFIPALLDDNPALAEADPGYRIFLMGLPEDQRKALLKGDWDVYQGQFFSEFSQKIHVVRPFQLPDYWYRFGAYDHGFAHNAAFGWFAVDTDGLIYLYREFVTNRWQLPDIAKHINSYGDTKKLSYMVAGHDLWLPARDGGPSMAEDFSTYKLNFSPASIERVTGWQQVRSHLKWCSDSLRGKKPEEHPPKFKIFSKCKRAIECLPSLIHDPNNGEDVLKVDCNETGEGGDDAGDMIRYGLMSRPLIAVKPEEEKRFNRHLRQRRTGGTGQDEWNQDV